MGPGSAEVKLVYILSDFYLLYSLVFVISNQLFQQSDKCG